MLGSSGAQTLGPLIGDEKDSRVCFVLFCFVFPLLPRAVCFSVRHVIWQAFQEPSFIKPIRLRLGP
jgi:hypothetical protein